MEFKIPKPTQLIIDAWRAGAEILNTLDMDDYTEIHDGEGALIDAVHATAEEMHRIADQIEQEQTAMLGIMKARYDAKYKKE